jgi:hypothetical protein
MKDLIQIKAVVESLYEDIDISIKTRRKPYPDAIKIYSYIARKKTNYGTVEISKLINRSHSTVCIAIAKCNDLMQVDKDFRNKVSYCTNKCGNILNHETATYKEKIDIIFSKLSDSQQEELYVRANNMFSLNNVLKKEIHYVS